MKSARLVRRWRSITVVLAMAVGSARAYPACAAGTGPVAPFCSGDADGDGLVTVDEIVLAVNNALDGCAVTPVGVRFEAVVGDAAFACGGEYAGIGSSQSTIRPADLRFYVYDVRLVNADGIEVPLHLEQDGIWQYRDVALLDFEDRNPPCTQGTVPTNTTLRGTAPSGRYTGLRFVLGVPFALNHADPALAASPLNLTAMHWDWQGGYKFFRFDDAETRSFVHLGSTGCEYGGGDRITRCARPNRGEVFLTDFDPLTATVRVDVRALLDGSDLAANTPETPKLCMSGPDDPDCTSIFEKLGVNFGNGMPDPSRQRLFRVD